MERPYDQENPFGRVTNERTNSIRAAATIIDALDRFFRGRVFRRNIVDARRGARCPTDREVTTISAARGGTRAGLPAAATGVRFGDNARTAAAVVFSPNALLVLFMTTYIIIDFRDYHDFSIKFDHSVNQLILYKTLLFFFPFLD